MPAHQIDLHDPKSVARLLLAIVLSKGGEVKIPASTYDSIDRGRLLLIDFDRATSELVVRASSDWGRAMTVQPESFGWTQPQESAPREVARQEAAQQVRQSTTHSDEELADMEDQMIRRQKLAKEAAGSDKALRIRTVK